MYTGSMDRSARSWAARVLGLFSLVLAAAGWAAASSDADVTIGEIAPMKNPPAQCGAGPYDEVPVGPASGPDYTVPVDGTITSWRTQAAEGEGQVLVFKVFRPEGMKFKVVAHDGPRPLAASTVNTFAVSIPVKAGDVIGYNDTATVESHPSACTFHSESAEDFNIYQEGEALDGEFVESGGTETFVRPNISAVVTTPETPPPPVVMPLPPVPAAHCVVPKLKGLKLKAAKRKIRAAQCAVGQVSKKPDVTTKTGKVVKQKPQTGEVKAAGAKIAVTLGG
jgi:hypothetical protein